MPLESFLIPEQIVMEKADDFHGIFTLKPLEVGFGVTIGNTFRRLLLSSLEGYAISGIFLPGVLHEFSTVKGVVEDISEIILNLKKIRLKKNSDIAEEKINVKVSNTTAFTGKDISDFSSKFEVLNPELVIFNCEKSVEFNMELSISKGRGYVPAEENKIANQPIGYIPIDTIYTPIKNVKYFVENTRVKQKTDYEQLVLDITTDGSIHPETALKNASSILIRHFAIFSDNGIVLDSTLDMDNNEVDEEMLKMRKMFKTPLKDLGFSVRAYNCLKAADVKTLGDLAQLQVSDMMKFRNFGRKSLAELQEMVETKNLTFGMDLSMYKLDEE